MSRKLDPVMRGFNKAHQVRTSMVWYLNLTANPNADVTIKTQTRATGPELVELKARIAAASRMAR
jgi:hypothetical protein